MNDGGLGCILNSETVNWHISVNNRGIMGDCIVHYSMDVKLDGYSFKNIACV